MVTGFITGAIGDFSGNIAGAKAAASALNAQGGIGGHPVAIVSCNDEVVKAKAAQCAQQAVDSKVSAVIGSAILLPDYYPILEAAKIPIIGGSASLPQDATSPVSYPLTGGSSGEFASMGSWAASNLGKNIVVLVADAAQGDFAGGLITASAKAAGGTPLVVKAPVGAPDYSPFASEVAGHKPDAVILGLVPTDVVAAVKALRGQGYSGPVLAIEAIVNQKAVDALGDAADGLDIFTSWARADASTSEVTTRFNKDMTQYSPDVTRDPYTESGWSSVNVVAAALKGSATVDAAAVVKGLDTLTVDLVGMAAGKPFPLSATSGVSSSMPRIFNPEVTIYQFKGGKVTQVQDFYNPLTNPSGK